MGCHVETVQEHSRSPAVDGTLEGIRSMTIARSCLPSSLMSNGVSTRARVGIAATWTLHTALVLGCDKASPPAPAGVAPVERVAADALDDTSDGSAETVPQKEGAAAAPAGDRPVPTPAAEAAEAAAVRAPRNADKDGNPGKEGTTDPGSTPPPAAAEAPPSAPEGAQQRAFTIAQKITLTSAKHGSGAAGSAGTGAPPRVSQGKPPVVNGIDEGILQRILRAHGVHLKACYETARQQDPALEGTVTLRFVIDARGRVSSTTVRRRTLQSEAMEACVLKHSRRWKFPRPGDGKDVTVTFTAHFSPE